MKTENLAILLTDIAGFTAATARQSREENATWLEAHGQLLRPTFTAFGGNVVKEIGDAFLCTFRSPTDAVKLRSGIRFRRRFQVLEVFSFAEAVSPFVVSCSVPSSPARGPSTMCVEPPAIPTE